MLLHGLGIAARQDEGAADGHRNLILTMAMDLSAACGEIIKLPVDINELGIQ